MRHVCRITDKSQTTRILRLNSCPGSAAVCGSALGGLTLPLDAGKLWAFSPASSPVLLVLLLWLSSPSRGAWRGFESRHQIRTHSVVLELGLWQHLSISTVWICTPSLRSCMCVCVCVFVCVCVSPSLLELNQNRTVIGPDLFPYFSFSKSY